MSTDLELFKLADGPIIGPSHRNRMDALLRHFCEQGRTLEECTDSRRLGRAVSTLKPYARRLGLAFIDYLPRALMNHGDGMYYLPGTGPAKRQCRECRHCGEAPPARKGGQPVPNACLKMLAALRRPSAAKNIGTSAACKYFEERPLAEKAA